MTDETTARDRAIERAYTVALGEITSAAISTPADTLAMRVVLALLAHPEVLRALAGAPTADVAKDLSCRFCSNNVEVITDEDSPGCGDIECVQCAARWDGKTGALMWSNVAPLAAAPEGVDAADEQEPCLSRGCTEPRGHTDDHESADGDTWDNSIDDPGDDGMDLEAHDVMADQLAAAQAAIQRVREVCAKRCGPHDRFAIAAVLRALDGDTTKGS